MVAWYAMNRSPAFPWIPTSPAETLRDRMRDVNLELRVFDDGASHYDPSTQDESGLPFEGYGRILDEITRAAGAQCGMKVLDLGIGTGNLAARF